MRALSHIGMQKLGCLFSVEVVSITGLQASMNGLRLSVSVRKKESKDGAVQTMPSRVLQGCADFEETLFLRCHIFCSGGGSSGKQLKFEPRPFTISAIAVDASEIDFGKGSVDLSLLVKESLEKNLEGVRLRQWERSFKLSGKAKGGELLVKLGFQIMDDGGIGIYSQMSRPKETNSPFSRGMSKSSFIVSSPRVETKDEPAQQPPEGKQSAMDDFKLDEPSGIFTPSSPSVHRSEPEEQEEELPDFQVEEKGVETKEMEKEDDEKSTSSEVIVKEVVEPEPEPPSPAQQRRMTELDSIAKQIEALESLMSRGEEDDKDASVAAELDAEEETLTREFLHMLDVEEAKKKDLTVSAQSPRGSEDGDFSSCFIPDLGKGLGSVVQTKDGGYLAAMNPTNIELSRKETPKLAMQISKPMLLLDQKAASGFEIFQRMAAMGSEELSSKLLSLASLDELVGKTAEQTAFEGVASAVISGRNKEGATSQAAKSVAAVKNMATWLETGRKERILTGIWNSGEDPVTAEDILPVVLQKIEAMAIESLKIQADMADEEAPFDVFTLAGKDDPNPPLTSIAALEDSSQVTGGITLLVVVQVRDPLRRYEMVGAPVVAIAQATAVEREEEVVFRVESVHVGGIRARQGRKSGWDGEKQRLTAMQWLVANGMGKAGKKTKVAPAKNSPDLLWSLSSRTMAGMWLKQVRNPDVKFPRQP